MKKLKNDGFFINSISAFLKDKLKDFFINVDFTVNFSNNESVFFVKDVDIRHDILKRFGIPLELSQGKIDEIKITIKSLTLSQPLLIEVSGIRIDLKTIYLSHNYAKDYKTFKIKALEEWEKRHQEFLKNLSPDATYIEKIMVEKLIPSKLEINDIGIRITDNVILGNTKPRIIGLYISRIVSNACNEKYEEISDLTNDNFIYRSTEITKLFLNIYKDMNKKDYQLTVSGNFSKLFIQPINISIFLQTPLKIDQVNLTKTPKIRLEIIIDSAIMIDLKNSKLQFIIGFLNYLEKIKKVEKFWIYRPAISEEMNHDTAKKWLKYAFDVIMKERREKKKKKFGLGNLMEKLIDMERYIHLYKASHKLIIAPWIHKKDCEKDLIELEEKMTLDDIIYCREISFNELLSEGEKSINNKSSSMYKYMMNLWEYYVKDIKANYTKNDTNRNEDLNKERRSLMILSKLDKDDTLISHLKGDQSHPNDKMINLDIKIKCVILTFSRNLNSDVELTTNLKFYRDIYNNKLKEELKNTHLFNILQTVSRNELKSVLDNKSLENSEDDVKNLNDNQNKKIENTLKKAIKKTSNKNEIEDDLNLIKAKKSISPTKVTFNGNTLKEFTDFESNNDLENQIDNPNLKNKNRRKSKINKNLNKIQSNNPHMLINKNSISQQSKNSFRKALFSIIIGNIKVGVSVLRNDKLDVVVDINSFNILDHNLSFIRVNKCKIHNTKIDFNDFDELECLKGNDFTSLIFNVLFYEKNIQIHPDKLSHLLPKCLSSFLIDTMNSFSNGNKNIFYELFGMLDLGLNNDSKFISDYILNFGLVKITNQETKTQINELYFESLFWFLLEKMNSCFEDKKDLLYTENFGHLMENIFDNYYVNKLKFRDESDWRREKNKIFVEDLCYSFKIVFIHIIKFIISAIYPYFLNEKNFQKFFKKNIMTLVDEIKIYNSKDFLSLKLSKEGKDMSDFMGNNKIKDEKQVQMLNGNLDIQLKNRFLIKISNQTIGELLCILPHLSKIISSNINFSGNVTADIKKSCLEIQENFSEIKSCWKKICPKFDKINSTEKLKEGILDSTMKHKVFDELKEKINIHISIKKLEIKVVDSLIFIAYDKISQVKFRIHEIIVNLLKLDRLPSTEIFKGVLNHIKHDKFDINDILLALIKINVDVTKIEGLCDNQRFLETCVKIDVIQNLLKNFPLFPDLIIDINILDLKLNIFPLMMKIIKLISNLSYYKDLYEKNFKINEDIFRIIKKESEKKHEEEINLNKKSKYFLKKYENSLEKIFNNSRIPSPFSKNKYLEFYNCLTNRQSFVLNLTVGNSENKNGLSIDFSENDFNLHPFYFDDKYIPTEKSYNSLDDSLMMTERKKSKINENLKNCNQIFSLNIPFILFNMNDSQYKNFKQLWISDMNCIKSEQKKEFEKLKIKFDSNPLQKPLNFNSVEILFCKHLMNCIKFSLIEEKEISEIKFNSIFPFDQSVKPSEKIKLHNVFSQISYYYEDQPKLLKLYLQNSIQRHNSSGRQSFFHIYIKEITAKIFLPPNSFLFNMINQMIYNLKYLDNADKNKFQIYNSTLNIKMENSNEIFLIKEKLSTQQINLVLKKFNLKVYKEKINNHKNLMFIMSLIGFEYNENMDDVSSKICRLSDLSINSINFILSIPHKFNQRDMKDAIPELVSKNINKLQEKMLLEENKLLVFIIEKINLRVIRYARIEIELVIENCIRFGFLKRISNKLSVSKMDLNSLELVFWIGSANSKNKYISDVNKNEIKDNSRELSLKLSLIIESLKKESNDDKLFYNLDVIITEIQRLLSLKYNSCVKLYMGQLNIEIPNFFFNYLYFLKNYSYDLLESFSNKIANIPQINQINVDFLNESAEYQRNHQSERDIISKYNLQLIGKITNLSENKKHNIFEIDIPYTSIRLKQRVEKEKEITFFNLGIQKINGKLVLDFLDRNKDLFTLILSDIDWKPYECKYKNLVIKEKSRQKSDPDFNIIKLEIMTNALKDKENENHDNVLVTVENISFIFIMKTVKEIIVFLEDNLDIFKDNPKFEDIKLLESFTKFEDILLKIKIINTFLIIPEASDSANYLGVKIANAYISIKEACDIPKLVMNPQENLQIIDVKTVYNLLNFTPEANELVPISGVQITGNNIFAYFYIDKIKEDLGTVDEIKVNIKSPKADSIIFLLRQLKWQKEVGMVVVAKPSVNIELTSAKIETNLAKLLGFNFFTKNNFDEKSSVFDDPTTKWDSIDFNFNIGEAGVSIDIFKIPSEFSNQEIEVISTNLPGKNNEILFDFE